MEGINLGLSVTPDHSTCIHSYSVSGLEEENQQKRKGRKMMCTCVHTVYILKYTALEKEPNQEMTPGFLENKFVIQTWIIT